MADCVVTKKNLGVTRCTKLTQLPKGMVTTPDDFRFTAAQAVDPDFWQDALLAEAGVYLWPLFVGFEDKSEEAIYETNALATIKVRNGRYQFGFSVKQDLCTHRAMHSHRANSGRVILWDLENQLTVTETGDDEFAGMTIQMLDTLKLKISDGSVSTKSPLYLVLADSEEIDAAGVIFDGGAAGANIGSLNRLTDVTITLGTLTTTDVTLSVTVSCDGTPVLGLVAADFVFLKTSDGSAQAKTLVDHGEGSYTLHSGTAFVDGTVALVAPSALTVEAYEGQTPVLVNIP